MYRVAPVFTRLPIERNDSRKNCCSPFFAVLLFYRDRDKYIFASRFGKLTIHDGNQASFAIFLNLPSKNWRAISSISKPKKAVLRNSPWALFSESFYAIYCSLKPPLFFHLDLARIQRMPNEESLSRRLASNIMTFYRHFRLQWLLL